MDLTRKLAEGVGSWLQYQYACNNCDLFSEQFLTEPIGRILSSNANQRVIAEYQHPILGPLSNGPGRKPSVDFVVCHPYPNIKIAVESKWIGKTKPSIEKIIWDIIRLELIANETGADCFFLLGGMKKSLDAYFKNTNFAGRSTIDHPKPILLTDKNLLQQFDLSGAVGHRRKVMKKLFSSYQDIPFPSKIMTRRSNPFPEFCKSNQYQIYVWKISSIGNRSIFYPKNARHYVTSTARL